MSTDTLDKMVVHCQPRALTWTSIKSLGHALVKPQARVHDEVMKMILCSSSDSNEYDRCFLGRGVRL